jgi:hypothetical protein
MRLAAEQLKKVAQGASAGNAKSQVVKLRSSDVYQRFSGKSTSLLRSFFVVTSLRPAVSPQATQHRCSAANRTGTTNTRTLACFAFRNAFLAFITLIGNTTS